MILSKSDYMLFLRHPAWLWLKKFDKNKLPPIDDATQEMFDAGHAFEAYAEKLFPDAIKLGFGNFNEYTELPARTKDALDGGAKTILQGRLEVDGLTCIFDILFRVNENEFDLIEIKASTKAKPEHEYDLAFQMLVLEKSGYKVRNISVIHTNKEYVRDGDVDHKGITDQTDVTENVKALKELTEQQISKAIEILQGERPDISPRFVNQIGVPKVKWIEEWMVIFNLLKPIDDPYNIYKISYPTAEQIGKLDIVLVSHDRELVAKIAD